MAKEISWPVALEPLLKKYRGKPHPLEYKNHYQLLCMVVLAAQSSDKIVNSIAVDLFKAFPSMRELAVARPEDLHPYISKVIGFRKKAEWLVKIGKEIKTDKNIPYTLKALTSLAGIGRKTANVILHEAGKKAEGVIVDLHVVRVAQRIGITSSDDPKIIEKDIMDKMPASKWGETGMAISFLGREICRPTDPQHQLCPVNKVCAYYAVTKNKTTIKKTARKKKG